MQSLAVSIILVEKFELFRNLIRAILEPHPHLRIVGEFTDAFDAVHQTGALKPDLILLDLRLSSLTGFDAARLLRTVAPDSKLIFVSQCFSGALAEDALRTGAFAFVLKSRAATDLLPAIEATLLGKTFVSRP